MISDISFSPNNLKLSIYLNSSCPIILGDYDFLRQHVLDFKLKVKYIAFYIPVYGFGNKVLIFLKFLNINLYIDSVDDQGPVIVKLIIEVYIINNLKTNILIGTSIFKVYKILLDLGT